MAETIFVDRRTGERWRRYQKFLGQLVPITDAEWSLGEWEETTDMSTPPDTRIFLRVGERQTQRYIQNGR